MAPAPARRAAPAGGASTPTPALSFDGIGLGFGTFVVTGAPPDTNGDVGPTRYLQAVNVAFAVFDKSGAVLAGPTDNNQLFSGWSGDPDTGRSLCAGTNRGDVVALYDQLADRWFISQFAWASPTTPPYYQCVAVSETSDPAGAYYTYAFGPITDANGIDALNDYAKFGVWPDAYYAMFHLYENGGAAYSGTQLCAMERSQMLVGAPARLVCLNVSPGGNYFGFLPAHLIGPTPPPAGTPGLFMGLDVASGALTLWRLHVDWVDPASSVLAGPVAVPTPAYRDACPLISGFSCVDQPGTSQKLDALGFRLMFRLAYRNFGDHEALVVNQTVDDGSGATSPPTPTAVRWYEYRNANGQTLASAAPILEQSGTLTNATGAGAARDGMFRWTGSAAMDGAGNLAVGYSVSNGSTQRPGLAWAGRLAADPPNALSQGEAIFFTGAGSQTSATRPLDRWGDYSSLSVDPADDCTFWYTNEYIPVDGIFDWKTRIASFKFPGCARGNHYVLMAPISTPDCAAVTIGLQAVDGAGALLPSYAGAAQLSSTDPRAVLPPPVSFTGGVASGQVTLKAGGSRLLVATEAATPPTMSGTASIAVLPGPAASLSLSGVPATWTAGATLRLVLEAADACGTLSPAYAGPDAGSSDDPAAVISVGPFSGGIARPLVTLKTAGARSIAFADTGNAAISASAATTVVPGSPWTYRFDAVPGSATAGKAISFTVTALDSFGNVTSAYAGPARVTSSDPKATLPDALSFSGGSASGGITFQTAGTQTLVVTDAARAVMTASAEVEVKVASSGCGCGPGGAPAGLGGLLLLLAAARLGRRRGRR